MSLTYIFGRSGYGKTAYILEHALTQKKAKYILVPEQINFEYEKKLLKTIPDTIAKNIAIVTFSSLARRIFYETGGTDGKSLDKGSKALITYRVLKELGRELSVFRTKELSRGLLNKIAAQIREFKNSLIDPEELGELSQKLSSSPFLSDKLKDLSRIYKGYEDHIRDRYTDGEDELSMVIAKIPKSEQFRDCLIYIDAFSSFSKLEQKVIEALMKNNNDIFLSITVDAAKRDADLPVWNQAFKTIDAFSRMASEYGIDIKRDVIIPEINKKSSPSLCFLEKNMFEYTSEVYKGQPSGIYLSKYQDPYSEVEAAAIQIRKLVREKDLRYRDISITVSDVASYAPVISGIFGIYDIPCCFDEKIRLSTHPLALYILDAIKAISEGYRYETMAVVMKSDYSAISSDEADILENHVLEKGIRGLGWFDEMRFKDEDINDIWQRFITPIHELYIRLKEDMSGEGAAGSIYRFMIASDIPGKLMEMSDAYIKGKNQLQANRLNQAYSALIGVLDDIYSIFSGIRLSLTDISRIIECAFSEHTLASIPFGMDEIFVGDMVRSRKEEVQALFVIGANDGAFVLEGSGGSVFTESELQKLIENGFDKVKDPNDIAKENESLLYSILTRPRWYLFISCPLSDMTGRMLAHSNIFSRMAMLYESMKIFEESASLVKRTFDPGVEFTKRSLLKDISIEMQKKKSGIEIDDTYALLLWYLEENAESKMMDVVFSGLRYDNDVEKVDSKLAKELFGESVAGSVTRLQRFRECPFSFFMEYGLNARERTVWQFTGADAGLFVHRVLERFQKRIFLSREVVKEDDIDAILADVTDAVLRDETSQVLLDTGVYTGIRNDLAQKLSTTCRIIYENTINSDFKPFRFEAQFDEGREYPPLILKTESGEEIRIHGKIDRIDVFSDGDDIYFTVIDYKTGSREFSLSDIYHGLDLQLLVYMDALMKSEKEAKTAGAFYFHVKDPIVRKDPGSSDEEIEQEIKKEYRLSGIAIDDVSILDSMDRSEKNRGHYQTLPVQIGKEGFSKYSKVASAGQFISLFGYVEEKLCQLSEQIKKGTYAVKPVKNGTRTACDFCSYKKACQFDLSLRQNRYEILMRIKDEDFWGKIDKEKYGKEVES